MLVKNVPVPDGVTNVLILTSYLKEPVAHKPTTITDKDVLLVTTTVKLVPITPLTHVPDVSKDTLFLLKEDVMSTPNLFSIPVKLVTNMLKETVTKKPLPVNQSTHQFVTTDSTSVQLPKEISPLKETLEEFS